MFKNKQTFCISLIKRGQNQLAPTIILLCFLFSFFFSNLKANELNKYFYLDTLFFLPKEFADDSKIIVKSHKEEILCLYNELLRKNDSNFIQLFDVKTKKFNYLFIPNEYIDYFFVRDFDFDENKLFLLFFKGIIHYQRKLVNFEYYDIIKIKSVPNEFIRILLEDEKIHLFDSYINYDNLNKKTIRFLSINTKNHSEDIKEFSGPMNIFFLLFQPRKCMDYFKQKILVSEITKYQLYIYSLQKGSIDTIVRFPSSWVPFSLEDSNKIDEFLKNLSNKNFKNFIDFLRPFVLKISTIHKVSFLGDSTVLVYWSKPPRNPKLHFYDFQIEIFKLVGGKWVSIAHNLKNEFDKDEIVSDIVIINNSFSISEKNIFCIEPIPFNIKQPPFSNMSYKKFLKKVEEYYSKEQLQLALLIYKLRE